MTNVKEEGEGGDTLGHKRGRACGNCGRNMRSGGLIQNIDGTASRYWYCPWCGRQVTEQTLRESMRKANGGEENE